MLIRYAPSPAQYIGSDEKNEIQQFQQLLPALIAVVQGCLNFSDKTGARQLFDVFEMLLILEVPLLNKYISQLVGFFLKCDANCSYDN